MAQGSRTSRCWGQPGRVWLHELTTTSRPAHSVAGQCQQPGSTQGLGTGVGRRLYCEEVRWHHSRVQGHVRSRVHHQYYPSQLRVHTASVVPRPRRSLAGLRAGGAFALFIQKNVRFVKEEYELSPFINGFYKMGVLMLDRPGDVANPARIDVVASPLVFAHKSHLIKLLLVCKPFHRFYVALGEN